MSTILNLRVFIWDYTRVYDVGDIKNSQFQSSTRNNPPDPKKSTPESGFKTCGSLVSWGWKADSYKKSTRFQKCPDSCGRDLCIQTEASLLGFYCNKKPEHSQLYVSCLQLNLPSSRLSQKSLKSSAMIAAKKEASDWVDHTIWGDKNGAEIRVYIWTTGICNTREQTNRYQLVNDVGGPAKKANTIAMAILSTFLILLVLCSSALSDCSPGWDGFLSLIMMMALSATSRTAGMKLKWWKLPGGKYLRPSSAYASTSSFLLLSFSFLLCILCITKATCMAKKSHVMQYIHYTSSFFQGKKDAITHWLC